MPHAHHAPEVADPGGAAEELLAHQPGQGPLQHAEDDAAGDGNVERDAGTAEKREVLEDLDDLLLYCCTAGWSTSTPRRPLSPGL